MTGAGVGLALEGPEDIGADFGCDALACVTTGALVGGLEVMLVVAGGLSEKPKLPALSTVT